MFDNPYQFQPLGLKSTLIKNPISRSNYRFKAKCRTYFVTLEIFSNGIVAIKYCDVKDKGSRNAYKKIFNDEDAFRVITTCLFIMKDYWEKSKSTSFAFYAVQREWSEKLLAGKKIVAEKLDKYKEQYIKSRFTIYHYAMVNLFSPEDFTHLRDTKNCIYILLNKKHLHPEEAIESLKEYLLENSDVIFEVDGE